MTSKDRKKVVFEFDLELTAGEERILYQAVMHVSGLQSARESFTRWKRNGSPEKRNEKRTAKNKAKRNKR